MSKDSEITKQTGVLSRIANGAAAVAIIALLPLPLVVLENHNVRVDIFYQSYRPEVKAFLDRFGLLFFLFPATGDAAYIVWGP